MISIKVLLAEDSSFQRKLIAEMLLSNKEIEEVILARNGNEAIQKIEKLNPDVLILDLMMPEVDGITVFKFLSEHYPIPTIIFSAKSPETLDDSIKALFMGAFDFIIKPESLLEINLPKYKNKLISSILYAGKVKKTYEKRNFLIKKSFDKSYSLNSCFQRALKENSLRPEFTETSIQKDIKARILRSNVIAIGASTGGPKTLRSILKSIPNDFEIPILIVQHLDPFFMKEFSKSLNRLCKIEVKLAEHAEKVLPGIVYISPGGKHMKVQLRNQTPYISINKGEPVNFCIPSVDVLFFSVSKIYKNQALGILLTGLGEDGAAGLKAIKKNGGDTIAESEETCIVYGMPKAAVKRGAVNLMIPNYKISDYMMKYAQCYRNC